VWRCPIYEFEDIILEDLEPGAITLCPAVDFRDNIGVRARRVLDRFGVRASEVNLGFHSSSLDQDVELFFFAAANTSDLEALYAIRDWRKRSNQAVCFLQELWVDEIEKQLPRIGSILSQFDHVFVGLYHTAEALKKRLEVPVHYLSNAVDAERFNPYRGTPKPRSIDVCAVGHVAPLTHEALWKWAEETGRFYSYTSTRGPLEFSSHRVHRHNLVQTLQRSKFFLSHKARVHQPRHQEEFGPRYFEGTAAGTVLLGQAVVSNPAFIEDFDWEGAVVEAPFESADYPALIEELEKDAEWLERVRRANVQNCLTRHDHLNRWDQILSFTGLTETDAIVERRNRLVEQAAEIERAPFRTLRHTRFAQ
jgi:hypothetical protein